MDYLTTTTTIEHSYENQVENLKCQIAVLKGKVSYYEKEYCQNNIKIMQDIKLVEEREMIMQREINVRDGKLEEAYNGIKGRDEKIGLLEGIIEEIKMKNDNERNKIITLNITEKEEMNTLNDELKNENGLLKKSVDELTIENTKLSQELIQVKEDNRLFNQDNDILLQKLQEYEEDNAMLHNDKNTMEESLYEKNDQCLSKEKLITEYDNQIEEYKTAITQELEMITQWIDTYLGFSYASNYDVTKLNTTNTSYNTPTICDMSLNSLKNSLEKARVRLIEELTSNTNHIQRQKNEINELIISRDKKQYELNEARNELQEYKEKYALLQQDNDDYASEVLLNKSSLNKLHTSVEEIAQEHEYYLKEITSMLKKEIETICNDNKMAHYRSMFTMNSNTVNKNKSININSTQYNFEDAIERLIHFITIIKEDYLTLHKINDKLSSESINKKGNCFMELNELNGNMSELKKEMNMLETALSEVRDENNLLLSQIAILEDTIQQKNEIINNTHNHKDADKKS